jgi:hypothetical protein
MVYQKSQITPSPSFLIPLQSERETQPKESRLDIFPSLSKHQRQSSMVASLQDQEKAI